jgi:hypothetical protein
MQQTLKPPRKITLRYFASYQFYSKHPQKWRLVRNLNGEHRTILCFDSQKECEDFIALLPQTPVDPVG